MLIGGGVVEQSDLFLEPTRAAFAQQLPTAGLRTSTVILPAALGEHAGAIGAAVLARGLA
jgi:predicted NBD/HSP70 family sugar kinase